MKSRFYNRFYDVNKKKTSYTAVFLKFLVYMSFHHLFDVDRLIYPSKRPFRQNIVGHTKQLQAQTTGSMSVVSFVEGKVRN